MSDPVVHFEMPYEDRDRMVRFYEKVFGWKAQKLGPEMGNYVLVTTAETDVKPDAPRGAINGGFWQKRSLGQHRCPPWSSVWPTSAPQWGRSAKREARFLESPWRFQVSGNTSPSSIRSETGSVCSSR